MDDRIDRFWSEWDCHSISDDRPGLFAAAVDRSAGPQGRHAFRYWFETDDGAAVPFRQIEPGPPAPGADVKQEILFTQRKPVADLFGLQGGGVPVCRVVGTERVKLRSQECRISADCVPVAEPLNVSHVCPPEFRSGYATLIWRCRAALLTDYRRQCPTIGAWLQTGRALATIWRDFFAADAAIRFADLQTALRMLGLLITVGTVLGAFVVVSTLRGVDQHPGLLWPILHFSGLARCQVTWFWVTDAVRRGTNSPSSGC